MAIKLSMKTAYFTTFLMIVLFWCRICDYFLQLHFELLNGVHATFLHF